MAFPTTGILDNGTSPVENPISTNWDGPIVTGTQPLQRTATGIARGSALGGSWYDVSTYGPDCEAYCTINVLTAGTNATESVARVRFQQVGTAGPDGYLVEIRARATASTDRIRLYRADNDVWTQIGSTYTVGTFPSPPFRVGISAVGNEITAWYDDGSGTFVAVITVTDATYPSAGYLGSGMTRTDTRITDFGGGSISSTPAVFWLRA
jgi:hypothetical protein